jgi:putative transposase
MKRKGSESYRKQKVKVAKVYEKIGNVRKDFIHKTSRLLVDNYSLIALEDLNVRELAEKDFGKQINDAAWSMLGRFLTYKAGNAGSKVLFVDARGTTKTCSGCGHVKDMPLGNRTYVCPVCGLEMDRDLNAAKNILNRATPGTGGSNASGDGTGVPSMKEELCLSKPTRFNGGIDR